MSTPTNRATPTRDGESVDQRLARLLDAPFLAKVVPHLAPETLHHLIQHRGLDACGELVTLATPAQLTSLLDLDLWRHAQAGRDEQFNVDRFGEWLEVLVDTGESVAARTVAALETNIVVTGLSRYLRVFDPGTFEPTASSDDESIDRNAMMNFETNMDLPECEVGGYLIRARRTDAWDAIVTLLVTLEIEHHHYFHAVMEGCRRLSYSKPELDGLDNLLLTPDQHLYDVVSEREQRRSRQGYTTPADARAFLQLARQPRGASSPNAINPIAAAYFRAVDEELETASQPTLDHAAIAGSATTDDDMSTSIETAIELLAEAGMMPERPRALLPAADEDPRTVRLPLLRRLMNFLRDHDEPTYLRRSRELAFLANTLVAGCAVQSRPFTAQEASDAAAGICNLGLECRPNASALTEAFLVEHDLVAAFEDGWSTLYRDVSLYVADQLIATLSDLRCADADTRLELGHARRVLVKHRQAGTPWLARDACDALSMLDLTASFSVRGLLDECPIIPAAMNAILERRSTSVSPLEFEFISTAAQIGDVRLFMKALPGLLGGYP